MRVLADIATVVLASSTVIGFLARRLVRRRRARSLDHVRDLERENAEMDEALRRMRGDP